MAEKIVNSIFGVDPAMYSQLKNQQNYADALAVGNQYAVPGTMMNPSLGPLYTQAAQQGQLIGGGVGTLLGAQDPELQKITAIKQLSTQFDLTSPTGMREFSRALQQIAPNESIKAAKRADEMTLNAASVAQKMREKATPASSLGKLLDEKQQLLDAGLPANDPRVLAYDEAIQATGLSGKKAIAKASAPGGGPDTRGKAFELADPEALKEYRTGSRAASGQLALISQARENLPNAVVGQGLPAIVRGLNAQLAPLGINTETVANTRNLEQALKSIIAQGIKAYGANPSTVDLQFAIQAAADIKDPQKAIDATLNYLEQKATKAVDKADAAEQWLLTKGNLAGFEKDWNKQVNTPKNKPKTITLPSGVVVTVGE
jgi:hypothetical protein